MELIKGKLIKRYKRFLADVELEDGSLITAHCPNTGAMTTCKGEGWPVLLSVHDNPNRKYKHTWEMVYNGNCWISINTHRTNQIVCDGIKDGLIPELAGYEEIRREVKYGENSRVDILLTKENQKCYVEIKSVTLVEDGVYMFPDAVTKRGLKHLNELENMVKSGHRAVIFYLLQRSDGSSFSPAAHIDPDYALALKESIQNGVEILVYNTVIEPPGIRIKDRLLDVKSPL